MFRKFKIATRITLLILLGTGALISILSWYDYYHSRSIIEGELKERARNLARATANELEIVNRAVEKIVNELAITLRESLIDQINLEAILNETLAQHQEVGGIGILLDQDPEHPSFLYGFRKDDTLQLEDILATSNYHYKNDDWYQLAVHVGPSWGEPYFGSVSQSLRVTYAVPLLNPEGTRIGVILADVDLYWLTKNIEKLQVGAKGKAFVVSRNGTFITYPDYRFIMRESLFSLARELDRPELQKIGKKMQEGESDFVPIRGFREDRKYWLAYSNIADSGWSMGVLFDQAELYSQLFKLIRDKILYGVICMLLLVALAWWIARSISLPIQKLESAANRIATGDLETHIPTVEGKNEIANLSQSFAQMQHDLQGHVQALQRATAEKARIESDLEIARSIQNGLLPVDFENIDSRCLLHALLEPAREVGGDFYDFEMLDDSRLFFAIGDASGKGVPAALFAALTRTMLRIHIRNHSPAKAMAKVNNELAANNDANMFVTLFAGVLDLKTLQLHYANGGHHVPVLLRQGAESPLLMPKTKGIVVGPMPDMVFEDGSYQLEPHDTLLLYTDGVVEAEDGHAFYGEDRMMRLAEASFEKDPEQIVNGLLSDVIQFRGSYEQSDDITVFAIGLKG